MKASRTEKRRRRRSNTQGRKIENNHKKEASGATLITPRPPHRPNRGLIDVYRLRHFSSGTSVIRSSLSLLAAPSSRCDAGKKTNKTLEAARTLGRLSRDTLNALCQARFFFVFRLQLSYPLPLQLLILQVATASLELPLPQTGSGGPLPPFHPPAPASQQASL